MTLRILFATIIIIGSLFSQAQNVGIDAANPTEKLEVGGIIYTNEGGIKFPDETVQTTAAFMDPPETYPIERGVGFIEWKNTDLDGILDTVGLHKVSLVYNISFNMHRTIDDLEFGEFNLIKQTDRGSPGVFKFLMTQVNIPTVTIHMTRLNSEDEYEVYYKIKLTNVQIITHTPSHQPALDGFFQHTDVIGLAFQTMTLTDLTSGKCYCYNFVTNLSCSCP